jgi:hypothetical protein
MTDPGATTVTFVPPAVVVAMVCFAPIDSGQWRARRHGNAGIYGNAGMIEAVTYRI